MRKEDFKKINDYLWELPKSFRADMRVPARIYVSEKMLEEIFRDRSLEQLVNIATLPGIQKYALAMPDMHEGYASCIGGVGAIRISDGIISPGMQGYDINCLAPNSKVLLENGCYTTIKELEENWDKQKVNFVNLQAKKIDNASLVAFLKKYNNPTIFRITTQSKEIIEATGDHPVQTKEGMKEARLVKEKDYVLIYPFKGVRYENPSSETILSEEKFRRVLKNLGKDNLQDHAVSQILNQLKSKNLLPLRFNSPALPIIIKIMGFIFGDGMISFINQKKSVLHFYGKSEDLQAIQKDIAEIGFKPSRIYSRLRHHSITTFYKNYKFSTTEHSIKNGSSSLAALLIALGTPYGVKSHQSYRVPVWVFRCPVWQKRLFLASFFGVELSTPSTLNKYNFYAPQFSVQKKKGLEKNAKLFLGDIKKILKEFGVQSSHVQEVLGYRYSGKQGKAKGFRLQIKESAENLIRFFENVGYEYNLAKQKKACLAAHYLRIKLNVVQARTKAREEIQALYKKKGDFKKISERLISEYIPLQFLYHSIFKDNRWGLEGRRGKPRIAFDFPSFGDYKKRYAYGDRGLVWDKIEKIEKIPYANFVYDFTINNDNHNFIANGFVVSNCGMKLLKSNCNEAEIRPHLENLAGMIQREVPSGLGKGRQIKLSVEQIDRILEDGTRYLVEQGYGEKEDIESCEAGGRLEWAEASAVSVQAKNRGRDQVGTLGSGNHFLEIQKVAEIFDEKVAEVFGLFKDQIVVMIHCGSRGLGHQVCTDYLREFIPLMEGKYRIKVPDREFACVPFNSPEGQRGLAASACAANYAWANRQMIAHFVRKAWKSILGEKASPLTALYDVAHNIIKREKYLIDGKETEVAVHRKGATRAFPPGHPEISEKYREVGQPVLIPGSMGTGSYVLVGVKEGEEAFFSTCHGSGRTMSRHEAMRRISGQKVVKQLESKGIIVKCRSMRGIAEEAPLAYKNIEEVVEVVHKAGLSKKVAKLVPLAVIKGE